MDLETVKFLQTVRLFSGISSFEISHVLSCIGGVERSYSKGEYIFMEGEDLIKIGLIIKGSVQMIKEDVWGDKMILADNIPGDIIGESFVCNDKSASTVSFLAVNDCRILFLQFKRLMTSCGNACKFHQKLIENMIRVIAAKNLVLIEKMEILSKKTIRERIMVWLSQQVQKNGNNSFTSPMGRADLAEYLCSDRSAMTRELANMKRDGLLDFEKNTFTLNL